MAGNLPHNFVSPLRYPGGKGKVANFIKLLFLQNDLLGHHYIELYAGGASIALSLLFEEYASHIYINDLNRSIYAFWQAVLNDTDALCQRIRDVPVTIEEWHRQKSVQEAPDPDPLDLAFSTFFLNRTNRSGIIWGGVIGGKAQKGDWKLDARYNKADLITRIEKIARYRNRITATRLDAAEYLRTNLLNSSSKTLVYLDPPYYVKGKGLYEHFYSHQDHVEIARLVRLVTQPWVVSYDAAPEILDLYTGYEHAIYGLHYSAAARYQGAEVMFFCPRLKVPQVKTPANVHIALIDRLRAERALFDRIA